MDDNSETLEHVARIIYEAIFRDTESVSIDGIEYAIERTSKSKVRFVDYEGLAFIEQNPRKSSRWAEEAR
jgi:hypothetical protein